MFSYYLVIVEAPNMKDVVCVCVCLQAIHNGMNCKDYQDDLRIRAENDQAAQQTKQMLEVSGHRKCRLFLWISVVEETCVTVTTALQINKRGPQVSRKL